jgi:RNA polymerase sigma-70 factor (ECF subfamily)
MRQREDARPSPTVRGAGLWADFVEAAGDKAAVETFAAWGKAAIDPADPAKALVLGLPAGDKLQKWWTVSRPVFVARSAVSPFVAKTSKPAALTGKPRELAHDDGTSAGQRSIAGAGHAVAFDAGGDSWYLTTVRVYGSRYGTAQPPEEKFTVFLLDAEHRRIAEFAFPYDRFERVEPKWVELEVTPTLVPAKFVVGVDFQPTARKGVFVHHDAAGGGSSLTGIPGRQFQKFDKGDWMIRATVRQKDGRD